MSLAPSVRIRRRTGAQRRYVPRAIEAAEALLLSARAPEDARARAEVASRLGALRAALFRSPYYVGALRRAGLSPRDLRSLDDLPHFPTLDREALRERWTDLPALDLAGPEAAEVVAVQTSGSTGQPVTVLKDRYDCLHMWAVLRFWSAWLGIALPHRPRVVLLCSLSNGIEYSVRLPILDDGVLHRISLVRPDPLERLRRAAPGVLFSDPAGLHWLAAQGDPPRPRLILTSAQYFSPHERRRLHDILPVPAVNYYASADAGPIAWECFESAGSFHVLTPDVWVESLDGELTVTRLRPSVLPLLRYRTGDRGEVARGECVCGYRGWSIRGFTGRRECPFLTPEGRSVDSWRLAWLFKHYPLQGFRLTQRGPRQFDLEVVAGQGTPDLADLGARLGAALAVMGWSQPELTLRRVARIEARGDKPEPFRLALETAAP